MKAIVIKGFGGTDKLELSDIPLPVPGDDEVQIAIEYCGVNPVDWKIREGKFKTHLPHEFPLILGWDAAGIITAVGKDVKNFKLGDEVFAYCRKPIVRWGTYAEYICFDATNVALKPKNISFAQAAAIPLVGLTAWQALFDFAHLKKGETILIQAGAGGVGSLAIQFAKFAGAKIITTTSAKNFDYVKKLGADHVIDYTQENFVDEIKKNEKNGVDVVFEMIGGKTLQDSVNVLKRNGRLVSITQPLDPAIAEKHQIQSMYVFVAPNGAELHQIAELIEKGKVISPTIKEMKLEEVKEAHEKIQSGHTQGKIVLKVKK